MKRCVHCGKTLVGVQTKFCSNKCQKGLDNTLLIQAWLAGDDPGYSGKAAQLKPFIRRYLLNIGGHACSVCGWDKRHPVDGLPLVEVDHIDGDARNCIPSNLRLLCPNCHSMTPNFRARNKKATRIRKEVALPTELV